MVEIVRITEKDLRPDERLYYEMANGERPLPRGIGPEVLRVRRRKRGRLEAVIKQGKLWPSVIE